MSLSATNVDEFQLEIEKFKTLSCYSDIPKAVFFLRLHVIRCLCMTEHCLGLNKNIHCINYGADTPPSVTGETLYALQSLQRGSSISQRLKHAQVGILQTQV